MTNKTISPEKNLDKKMTAGTTLLIDAAQLGQLKIVELLINNDFDVNDNKDDRSCHMQYLSFYNSQYDKGVFPFRKVST